ncbi:MAG: hypothetical protein D6796_15255, partial [Caldilineae bacterium]
HLLKATPQKVPARFLISKRPEPARVVDLPPEGGKSVWGTLVLTPRGKARKVTFQYTLPAGIVSQTEEGFRYHLTLQKQAGTENVTAQVVVRLPPGGELLRAVPSPAGVKDDGRLVFNLSLLEDREVEVIFR